MSLSLSLSLSLSSPLFPLLCFPLLLLCVFLSFLRRFWEEAFFDALNSKIRRSAAARVLKWHSDAEQAESLHTRKQVCFSTLSTFAHNMSDVGHLTPKSIVEFVEKLSSIHELEAEHLAMLRSMEVYTQVDFASLDPAVGSLLGEAGIGLQQQQPEDADAANSIGEFESINAENDEEEEEEADEASGQHSTRLP
jgi:hypothetical protein